MRPEVFFRDGMGGWDHMDVPYGVQNEIHVVRGQIWKTGNKDTSALSALWCLEKERLEGQVTYLWEALRGQHPAPEA